jgi:hypothetical protein
LTSAVASRALPLPFPAISRLNADKPAAAARTDSKFRRPSGTKRATGFSCRVMMTSSPRATLSSSWPKRVLASKAVTLSIVGDFIKLTSRWLI